MRVITIVNPKILDAPYTLISQDYTSGTTLYVEDSSGFIDNDLIIIGGQGDEKVEVTDLTSTPPNDTSFAITALKFPHDADEAVQKVLYDKYDIQYKTSADGDWTALVTAGEFDWGKDRTDYVHSAGLSTNYYRSRYYNSATATYSDWSDSVVGTGYTRLQVGWLIARTRKKARDENAEHATDKEIIASFNTVNDIVKGMNKKWWFLKDEATLSTVASQKYISLPADFERAYRLKFNYVTDANDVEYYLKYVSPTEFAYLYQDNDADTSDNLMHYTVDIVNSRILLGPVPTTSDLTLTLIYFKSIEDLDTYGDTVSVPLADLYVHYAAAEIWETKDNEEKASYHKAEFANLLKVLEQMRVKNYAPRQMMSWKGREMMSRWYGKQTVDKEDWND